MNLSTKGVFGTKLGDLIKATGLSKSKFAKDIGVSRVSVNDWLNNKIPKGIHLIKICKYFNVDIDVFFDNNENNIVSRPKHRLRGNAKNSDNRDKILMEKAEEISSLFYKITTPTYSGKFSFSSYSIKTAKFIAKELRAKVAVGYDKPLSLKQAFELANLLGIYLVFMDLPKEIKSYAVYMPIYNEEVVIINTNTSIYDLTFALLHEIGHSVCSNNKAIDTMPQDEDTFCDAIASYTQLPDEYVSNVYETIKDFDIPLLIKTLKATSKINKHAINAFLNRKGFVENQIMSKIKSAIHGADSNVRKEFLTIKKEFEKKENIISFINYFNEITPSLFKLIQKLICDGRITSSFLSIVMPSSEQYSLEEIKNYACSFNSQEK